jgi:dinuclear metal center YbgI/SA1388 family protein
MKKKLKNESLSTSELEKFLDDHFDVNSFKDYCPNGLQIEGKSSIQKIAFSVSATLDAIKRCLEAGADALICHHGLLWNHEGARVIRGTHKRRLELCLKNNLNLFAYHLPMDGHPNEGNASSMAKHLGLSQIRPFGDYKGACIGATGTFKEAMPVQKVIKNIEGITKRKVIWAKGSKKDIKNISIVTGSGASYYEQAIKDKSDLFITGEMSEYHWHGAVEHDLHLVAAGHHATERFGVLALQNIIEKKFGMECLFLDSDNPV